MEVTCPSDEAYQELLEGPGDIVRDLLPLRKYRDLGPAVYLDATLPAGGDVDLSVPAGFQGFAYLLAGSGAFGSAGPCDRSAGARWSVGPEAGVAVYGMDVSYFGERVDGDTRHGFQVRTKLTVGLVAVYVRGAYVLSGPEASSLDVGLQLKLPVFIARNRTSMRAASRRLAAR